MLVIKFNKCHALAKIPTKADSGSNGYDLYAVEDGILPPCKWGAFATGLKIELPQGYVGWICPRSGLALKRGVTVLNTPGTVDFSFRGEVKVILVNHDSIPYPVRTGDKIAQILFVKTEDATFSEEALSETERAEGGFGHSGR